VSEHEGVSVWTKETAARLGRWIRFDFSRAITPNTADLMAMAEEKKSEIVSYREVTERLRARLAQPMHCPALHPVFPIELRISMARKYGNLVLKLFPNLDGFPTKYLPIRAYFCPVCQELYRQREIDEAMESAPPIHDSEEMRDASYTPARGAALSLSGLSSEEAIRKERD
jgi:hypothetical protein